MSGRTRLPHSSFRRSFAMLRTASLIGAPARLQRLFGGMSTSAGFFRTRRGLPPMKHSQARLRALAVIAASAGFILLLSYGIRTNNSPRMPHLASSADRVGVTLRAIDGGSNYFTTKSPRSRWLDGRMLLGSWLCLLY